ncbi:hypothetical protein BV25DRAFT_1918924 [Artomyces pyxidatus]|uniref:Uncharacterized protein n=2 Tax=Artomyces pyxidatus TaxID=48021 RepID=A0ACB8SNQ1_9AGAM|nr:hypothetical protein BV25DRAFT_1920124 [Artomyces pyxidatus]KAI0058808.1 hypothetical protein BV25DRAFT_1918924 [Artomyces pyxidatus]
MNRYANIFQKDATKYYGAPFDDAGAGITLRSSDLVNFRVYKVILAKASPVFKDMFSQGPAMREADEKETGTGHDQSTVFPVPEDSHTLAALLTLCYPLDPPILSTLEEMASVIAAAKKYGMDPAYKLATRTFAESQLLRERPRMAYGIMCRYRLEHEARVAARACLQKPLELDALDEELPFIDGRALRELWRYHRQCTAAVVALTQPENFGWITRRPGELWEFPQDVCRCGRLKYTIGENQARWCWWPKHWWNEYMQRANVALKDVPCGDTVTARDILRPSFQDSEVCDKCKGNLVDCMLEFSQYFADTIEAEISKIAIELPF